MEAGNFPSKETIEMDFLRWPTPKFAKTEFERALIFRQHHKRAIDGTGANYLSSHTRGSSEEIDCCCVNDDFSRVTDQLDLRYPTLLWVDPTFMPTECLAQFISGWKNNSKATDKVGLAIIVSKGNTSEKAKSIFEPWRIEGSKLSWNEVVNEPIWYPSLSRDAKTLFDAAAYLNPYDVFPLVEFSDWSVEWGERTVANHFSMLEQYRTRTRNLIYIDVSHPERAFLQFYGTLRALRQSGSIFQPVITPGGNATTFLATLLSGVLAEAYFLTPKEEIPINTVKDAEGVMVLRKCV